MSPSASLRNITLSLHMGYAKIIPQKSFVGSSVVSANSVQRWLISPTSAKASSIVFAVSEIFPSFNVVAQNKDPCSVHRLQIFDQLSNSGNMIFDGCSPASLPQRWLYSSTGLASVVLTVGAVDVAADFKIVYSSDIPLFHCGSFLQPNILDSASMVFFDGSATGNLMRASEFCTWVISPAIETGGQLLNSSSLPATVSLTLNWVSLKYGSSVVIYDGSDSSGTVLWTCAGPSLTVPPIVTSFSGSLYMVYQSDSSQAVVYHGFSGAYYSNYPGSRASGATYSNLAMSSTMDIYPPGDRHTATSGMVYTWFISPKNSAGVIVFAFQEMNLSTNASVSLYNGQVANNLTLMAIVTGSALPSTWFITTTNAAIVKYSSLSNETEVGQTFRLSYYSDGPNYHCGFSVNTVTFSYQHSSSVYIAA